MRYGKMAGIGGVNRASQVTRSAGWGVAAVFLLGVAFGPLLQAQEFEADRPVQQLSSLAEAGTRASPPGTTGNGDREASTAMPQLIVIGFMGGRVRAGNRSHREARMAEDLQRRYPRTVHAAMFANHDGEVALRTVLRLLGKSGGPSAEEKRAARIVLFGHSWGGSEAVTLARRLNELGVPVLLTIQVDSVQKPREDDGRIPPNVREAVNFYQSEGLLHGRNLIAAMDSERTTILGNYESSYRGNPVSCAGYPWYARAFMRAHIEIENDPAVWERIEALIGGEVQ
jgi:hypothetical protein